MEDRLLTDATLKLIGHDQRAPLMTMREITSWQDSKTARLVAAEIIQIVRDREDMFTHDFMKKYPDYKPEIEMSDYLTRKYSK